MVSPRITIPIEEKKKKKLFTVEEFGKAFAIEFPRDVSDPGFHRGGLGDSGDPGFERGPSEPQRYSEAFLRGWFGLDKFPRQRQPVGDVRKRRKVELFTNEQARQQGVNLAPDWTLRIETGPNGDLPRQIFISPQQWEFSDFVRGPQGETVDFKAVSPQGQTFTKAQLEVGDTTQVSPQVELPVSETIRTVFPERFELGGFPEEAIPGLVEEEITTFARTEPAAFISQLVAKGRTPEVETLINTFFDTTPEEIDRLFVDTVFPEGEEPVIPGGTFVTEVDGVRQLVTRTTENFVYDRTGKWLGYYDWGTKGIFNPYKSTGLVGQVAESFYAGVGDILNTAGGTARWLGFEDVGATLSTEGQKIQQTTRPPSYSEFQISDVLNPEFYATKVARTIPFALSLAPLAIGGFYAGAGLAGAAGLGALWTTVIGGLAGAALSRPAESALEAGSQYDDAIARGKTEKEAKEESDEVFRNNMVLAGADAWEIAIALAPTPKWVPASLIKSGLARTARIAGKMVIIGLSEGGEEVYQDMVQRRARGEDWQLDPVSKEVFAIGAVMGAGMGLGGDVISSVVNKSKTDMSANLKTQFDDAVKGYTEQGLSQERAELQALNDIAETPEGQKLLNRVVKGLKGRVKQAAQQARIAPEAGFARIPGERPEGEAPLTEALITEGEDIVSQAEAIQPDSEAVKGFRSALNEAKATDDVEVRRQALIQMESLEAQVREIAGVPEVGVTPEPVVAPEVTDRLAISEEQEQALSPEARRDFEKKKDETINEAKAIIELRRQAKLPKNKAKASDLLAEAQSREKELNKRGVELLDFTGQSYDQGLPHNVVTNQAEEGYTGELVVIQTLKPAIYSFRPDGSLQILQVADVIIGEPSQVARPPVTPTELARQEPGAPEAGIQPSMIEEVQARQAEEDVKADTVPEPVPEGMQEASDAQAEGKDKAEITELSTENPLPITPELTTEEVTENWTTVGQPKLTMKQAIALSGFFGDYVLAKDTFTAFELQRELWSRTRAERAEDFRAKMDDLIVVQGVSVEEAFNQATKITLAGELPSARTDFFEGMSNEMRGALFTVVYHNKELQQYPLELASTITALTNALDGKPIPRKRGRPSVGSATYILYGPEGASAWDRLNFVFGKKPKILKALEKMTEEKQSLKDVVDAVFHETGREPIPIDQEAADYLRNLSNKPSGYKTLLDPPFDNPQVADLRDPAELQFAQAELELGRQFAEGKLTFDEFELARREARDEAFPLQPIPKFDAPVDTEFSQKPLSGFNFIEQKRLVTALKAAGWVSVDIANLLRTMKTTLDNSFLRQGKVIASGHPLVAYKAHNTSWRAMFNQSEAEATWERIIRRPWYPLYEEVRVKTGIDPLRVPSFVNTKGTAQYRFSEEFGFISQQAERWIPRIAAKSPLIKPFERAFSAGTNEIVAGLLDVQYAELLRESEKVASGEVKLPVGEAFDIEKEFTAMMDLTSDMIQRATLPEGARGLAPVINAVFFAFRSKLARFLNPIHLLGFYRPQGGRKLLFNRRVMKEAWRNFIAFHSLMGGIMFLGDWLDLWELEKDPRNAEVMSARIGNTRIDPWAGTRQFAVLYARLVTRTGISSLTGSEYDVNPESAVQDFVKNSFSPWASALLEFWTGRNFLGAVIDFTDKEYWIEKVTAMSLWDIYEAFKMEGWIRAAQVTVPAIYGEGVQTYTGDWVENWNKLGLPRYPENLAEGIASPIYDTAAWWSDTSSQFKGVDPAKVTKAKGFEAQVTAIVEARLINEHLDTLPNERLASLNADPAAGATFTDYHQLWQDREALIAQGDKAEWTIKELQEDGTFKETTFKGDDAVEAFDRDETPQLDRNGARPKDAHNGNFSQRQSSLLNQYWAITDPRKQKEFLEEHRVEIGVNPRQDWLRRHPKENADLAIWGQAKVLTKAAYDHFKTLAKKYDIPDNAIPELLLPPETSVDTHFEYEEMVSEGIHSSNEAKLLILKDHADAQEAGVKSFVDWRNSTSQPLKLPAETIEYYQLRVDNSNNYTDLEEAQEADDEKEVEAVRARKVDGETFHDVERRVEAMGRGTRVSPISDELVNAYVGHMRIGDETSPNSAESKLNRYDDAALNDFLMDKDYWGKSAAKPLDKDKFFLDNYLVPRWRLDVAYRTEDGEYNALQTAQDRQQYLLDNETYRMDRRRREALTITNTKTGNRFPLGEVENFVSYWEEDVKGFRQERFLIEKPAFAEAMHDIKGIDIPRPEDVPAVQYDDISDRYEEEFLQLEGFADNQSEHYIEVPELGLTLDQTREKARDGLRFNEDGTYTEFGLAEIERNAHGKLVPQNLVSDYVGYYTIIGEGKPDNYKEVNGTDLYYEDDWYMLEHFDFYKEIYQDLLGNEPFEAIAKVPSREVFDKYLDYLQIDSRQTKLRDDFRFENLDLDDWLVLKFGYTPVTEKRRRAALTPGERLAGSIAELEKRLREHP